MPFNLSMGEMLVLLVVSILLFGGRLPQVARTIGKTIASFRRGMNAEMGRLDLELRGHETPPYNPAAHLRPRATPTERDDEPGSEKAAPPGEAADEGDPDARPAESPPAS